MKAENEKYMRRCLQLAAGGKGQVAPNPMVGSVVVANGVIIGEGFHRCYGAPHAEVHAISSVNDPSLFSQSTLYVNLEPCSHYGKTPPCAELIIKTGIPRVVVGTLDPFPSVSGRGVKMLREAGVEVITGCLEKECRELNRVFMVTHSFCRPYILLKWAESRDGFLDRNRHQAEEPPILFSTPLTSQYIHKRRSEFGSILVGTRTALLDNPSLTVRTWSGVSPIRCVLDRNLVIPEEAHLLDGSIKTCVFTGRKRENRENVKYILIDFDGNELHTIVNHLFEQKITSLMVEGGASLLNQFLEQGLWDEIQIESSNLNLQEGIQAPIPELYAGKVPHTVCRNALYTYYYRTLN